MFSLLTNYDTLFNLLIIRTTYFVLVHNEDGMDFGGVGLCGVVTDSV